MKKEWVTCSNGHRFEKSSAQPVCPICWPGSKKGKQGKKAAKA